MEFQLLGDVAGFSRGRSVDLGRRQQKLLLAVLLLEINKVVPTDRVCAVLWPDRMPDRPARTLAVYSSRLRRALTAADEVDKAPVLLRSGDGYVLEYDPSSVDAHRLVDLVDRARSIADPLERIRLLESARELWRGRPLGAVVSPELGERLGASLVETHRLGLELRLEAELAAGRYEKVVVEGRALVAELPGRERFVRVLMTALSRTGRRGEALGAYRDLTAGLNEDLGIDPSPELRSLAETIAGGGQNPANQAPTPCMNQARQLPPDVGLLVDRSLLVARGEHHLIGSGRRTAPGVLCLYGGTGIGKSATAIRLAHRVSHAFPDGQFFLRPADPAGAELSARDAVGWVLRGLGVSLDDVPDSLAGRVAVLRENTADKAVLVVADDVGQMSQVAPFLQLGPRCAVIATSRAAVAIRSRDVMCCELPALGADASLELLRAVSGREFDSRQTGELAEIVAGCAGLPLALRVVGARLGPLTRTTVAEVAAALADSGRRLDTLAIDDRAVRASLDLTLRMAEASTAKLLTMLVELRLDDFAAWVAAPLLDGDEAMAERELDRLLALGLVQLRSEQPRRFGIHDMVRAYVAESSASSTGVLRPAVTGVTQATGRYLTALVRMVSLADTGIDHGFVQVEGLAVPDEPILPLTEAAIRAAPDAWLAAEATGVHVGVQHAVRRGDAATAAVLALRLRGHLTLQDDSERAHDVLHEAIGAVEADDLHLPGLEARLLQSSFTTIAQHGDRIDELAPLADRSLQLARSSGSPLLQMAAYWQVGYAAIEASEFTRAAEAYEAALRLVESDPSLELHRGKALSGLGDTARLAGDSVRAVDTLRAALELDRSPTRWRATILFDLAMALVDADRATESEAPIVEARLIFDGLGDTFGTAYIDIVDARRAVRSQDFTLARVLLDSAAQYFLAIDDVSSLSEVRLAEAELSIARGRDDEAGVLLTAAVAEALAAGDSRSAHQCRKLLESVASGAASRLQRSVSWRSC
ncbi:NB-ARC domain-containing protein [Kribbella sp. NBC_01505]|uniref:AfsR/SARP family transcriptional regulator n=1 Tax=Kribbella sp. NBC_01505 TaxID=2903580 RepID=UPI003862DD28